MFSNDAKCTKQPRVTRHSNECDHICVFFQAPNATKPIFGRGSAPDPAVVRSPRPQVGHPSALDIWNLGTTLWFLGTLRSKFLATPMPPTAL